MMNVAHIWYLEEERDLIRSRIESREPDWRLSSFPEKKVSDLQTILELLEVGFQAVLVHLSLPFCLAIKMAEICHRTNNPTKVILFSRTGADPDAISGFFDGVIRPDKHIADFTDRIKAIVAEERDAIESEKELERRIVSILNTSTSIATDFRGITGERHPGYFRMEDYRIAIEASLKGRKTPENEASRVEQGISVIGSGTIATSGGVGSGEGGVAIGGDLYGDIRIDDPTRMDNQKIKDLVEQRDALREILGYREDMKEILARAGSPALDDAWAIIQSEIWRKIVKARPLFLGSEEVDQNLNKLGSLIRLAGAHPHCHDISSELAGYLEMIELEVMRLTESLTA